MSRNPPSLVLLPGYRKSLQKIHDLSGNALHPGAVADWQELEGDLRKMAAEIATMLRWRAAADDASQ